MTLTSLDTKKVGIGANPNDVVLLAVASIFMKVKKRDILKLNNNLEMAVAYQFAPSNSGSYGFTFYLYIYTLYTLPKTSVVLVRSFVYFILFTRQPELFAQFSKLLGSSHFASLPIIPDPLFVNLHDTSFRLHVLF